MSNEPLLGGFIPENGPMEFNFIVSGIAVTQGSMKSFVLPPKRGIPGARPRAIITHDKRPELMNWRQSIAASALAAGVHRVEGMAIEVTATFVLPRPASLSRKTVRCIKRPDLDKLFRSFDGLTGVAWKDDSQIDSIIAKKRYVREGESCGLHVRLTYWPVNSEL